MASREKLASVLMVAGVIGVFALQAQTDPGAQDSQICGKQTGISEAGQLRQIFTQKGAYVHCMNQREGHRDLNK